MIIHLYMGAGTQGRAVNGAYQVEILATYEDHGDGTVPEGVDAVERDTGELVERPVELHGPSTLADRMLEDGNRPAVLEDLDDADAASTGLSPGPLPMAR